MGEKKEIKALDLKKRLRNRFYEKYYADRDLLHKNASKAMQNFLRESPQKHPNS
ncbi:hypothetical protein [Gracilimonas sediminicola]|uniref:Uncharacterized protein n=1 Tax=Gracilimonas sediminicola TaxID=2952158 RepID=A0A9X2L315_9BACT|nr:hypothetical protein [Gracilimonas sediminicola]MCP9291337.1 hypothetical protein [Gracilimonas sediminicola]